MSRFLLGFLVLFILIDLVLAWHYFHPNTTTIPTSPPSKLSQAKNQTPTACTNLSLNDPSSQCYQLGKNSKGLSFLWLIAKIDKFFNQDNKVYAQIEWPYSSGFFTFQLHSDIFETCKLTSTQLSQGGPCNTNTTAHILDIVKTNRTLILKFYSAAPISNDKDYLSCPSTTASFISDFQTSKIDQYKQFSSNQTCTPIIGQILY